MPKLNGTHLPQRLAERLADLRAGKEVAARDIKALLSDEQIAQMDAAWQEQTRLRKEKRARTKEEEKKFGWKTKREIHIEAYERAVIAAEGGVLQELQQLQQQASIRQMRIYMDTQTAALKSGKDKQAAKSMANNALTRAGLRRMDGAQIGAQGLHPRDKAIRQMEDALMDRARSEMTAEEIEQMELLQEYEKSVRAKARKLAG